jgi:hypothetical protein
MVGFLVGRLDAVAVGTVVSVVVGTVVIVGVVVGTKVGAGLHEARSHTSVRIAVFLIIRITFE